MLGKLGLFWRTKVKHDACNLVELIKLILMFTSYINYQVARQMEHQATMFDSVGCRSLAATTNKYGIETNWYFLSSADEITEMLCTSNTKSTRRVGLPIWSRSAGIYGVKTKKSTARAYGARP